MLAPLETPQQVLGTWRQALSLVRSRSTSVSSARGRLLQAQAQARQALSRVLPNLQGNARVERNLLSLRVFNPGAGEVQNQNITLWNAGLSLTQSLVHLRSWHDLGTSRVQERAAAVDSEDVERLALAALADSIVSVIAAERVAEVNRVSLRSNLSVLDLTKKRTVLGAATVLDELRAEQEVELSRVAVVLGDEALRRAREALGLALGFPDAWGVAADIRLDQLSSDADSVCSPIRSPDERSDVRSARMTVEASERNISAPSYGRIPSLSLYSDLDYTSAPNALRPITWSLGAVLTVPIYDGGVLGAERDANLGAAEIARQSVIEVARQARVEATQAQRSVQVAQATFEGSRRARDIAVKSARLSRVAFLHGTGTSFDLVETARRQREAEIDVTIKEFDIARAQLAALLALSNCNL
ncbi:MAG: hypothetical protein RL685_7654 [Pseudomonadota bacterium]